MKFCCIILYFIYVEIPSSDQTTTYFQDIPIGFYADSDPTSRLVYLAARRWDKQQPRSVTFRRNVTDSTIEPVWTWRKIVQLDLSDNNLRCVPLDLNLPLLERLVISRNQLRELPMRLRLPKLVHLDLSNNQLETIPQWIPADLPELKHFDLSHNELRDVAAVMARLCASDTPLQSLELKGNVNLLVPPSQITERGGQDVCQYFMDLHRGKMTCWSQTVLVVGEESAGKTALCRALQGHKCPDREQLTENSTVGIDTVHWQSVLAFEINRLVGGISANAIGR